MPDPKDIPSAESRLRQMVEDSDKCLNTIAEEAGVSYLPFQRWMSGQNKSLKLSVAEALWEYFTGSKFA